MKKFTQLQRSLYKAVYTQAHDKVREICTKHDDYEHLLIKWFNECVEQYPDEFEEELLEMMLHSWSTFSWMKLWKWATDYYYNLTSGNRQELFTKEYVEFRSFFEQD